MSPTASPATRSRWRQSAIATLLLASGLWWGSETIAPVRRAAAAAPASVAASVPALRLAQTNTPGRRDENTLSYGEFLDKIATGDVRSVAIDPRTQVARVELRGQDTPQRVKLFERNTEEHQQLIELLRQQGVEFEESPSVDGTLALQILANVALVTLLLVVLIAVVRRSAKATNQAMSFGKARARFQMEAQTNTTFEDVAGIDTAKEELQEVVTFLKETERFTALGARIPKGVLLYGPPGTGKTLLARAVAGEAGVPFFSISGSEFVEMFVGVGASRVRDLFRRAKENAPCLVFIDEIDAVGRQRGVGIGGGNDEREQTLNQLLTEMDGFEGNTGVIVVAATNRPDVLDRALLRPGRFDRQIAVELPSYQGRLGILEVHGRTKKLAEDISLVKVAQQTPGLSGADLANLLNEAAILTARRRKPEITQTEIDDALDRITIGMTLSPLLDGKKKRMTAYHEVGHALLMTLLKHSYPLDKVTILPRSGGILGFAKPIPGEGDDADPEYFSRSWILDTITVALGGRSIEEEVFGPDEVDGGAFQDIRIVTRWARDMVVKYGMSDLGSLAFQEIQDAWGNTKQEYSEEVAVKIDREIRTIAEYCHQRARTLIREHRVLVDRLADVLVAEETVSGERFREIVAEYAQIPEKVVGTKNQSAGVA